MANRATDYTPDSAPFACPECGSEAVHVSRTPGKMLQVGEGARLHVGVECGACGHVWDSRHSEALRRHRAAKAGVGGEGYDPEAEPGDEPDPAA